MGGTTYRNRKRSIKFPFLKGEKSQVSFCLAAFSSFSFLLSPTTCMSPPLQGNRDKKKMVMVLNGHEYGDNDDDDEVDASDLDWTLRCQQHYLQPMPPSPTSSPGLFSTTSLWG